jgi:hypothetical protein
MTPVIIHALILIGYDEQRVVHWTDFWQNSRKMGNWGVLWSFFTYFMYIAYPNGGKKIPARKSFLWTFVGRCCKNKWKNWSNFTMFTYQCECQGGFITSDTWKCENTWRSVMVE